MVAGNDSVLTVTILPETATVKELSWLTSDAEVATANDGIISAVVSQIQAEYPRIDEAALDRKKIWQKVSYLYAKHFEVIQDDALLRRKLLDEYYR